MASEEPVIYKIHSLVRKVQTRTKRQKAAGRHRFVQRLAGGDITVRRARPATVTEEKIERHLAELQAAVREGKIEVRTPTGRVVDILDAEPRVSEEVEATKPLPNPPLDSAANDKTFEYGVGEDRPLFEGGDPQGVTPESATNLGGLVGDDENAPVQTAGDPALARAAEASEGQAPTESTELPEQPDSSGLLDMVSENGATTSFPGTGEVNEEVTGSELDDESTTDPSSDEGAEATDESDAEDLYDVDASNAADAIEHIRTIESLEEVTRVYSAEVDGKGRTTVISALEAREAQLRGEE